MAEDITTQSQEEIRKIAIINPWKIFFWEGFLFSFTLGLGIITALKIKNILNIEKTTLPAISLWQFILYFSLATIFILFIARFLKFKKGKGILFRGIFVLTVFWGGSLALSLWLSDFPALVLVGILLFWWLTRPSVFIHNLAVMLGIAGVGAVLGLRTTPWLVVLLLIILSIYDFVAVYKTKHMIKMAKEMVEHRAILALIVPQKISDFGSSLEEVRPGGRFLILGGGDIAFPLLLAVSLIPGGIINSLIVAVFSLFGLLVSYWFFINQRVRRPIPALPPIALFSILGFLITLLL